MAGRMNWDRAAKEGQMRRWGSTPLSSRDQTLVDGKFPQRGAVKDKPRAAHQPPVPAEKLLQQIAENEGKMSERARRRAKIKALLQAARERNDAGRKASRERRALLAGSAAKPGAGCEATASEVSRDCPDTAPRAGGRARK